MTADAWSALAGWVAALVAIVAAIVAARSAIHSGRSATAAERQAEAAEEQVRVMQVEAASAARDRELAAAQLRAAARRNELDRLELHIFALQMLDTAVSGIVASAKKLLSDPSEGFQVRYDDVKEKLADLTPAVYKVMSDAIDTSANSTLQRIVVDSSALADASNRIYEGLLDPALQATPRIAEAPQDFLNALGALEAIPIDLRSHLLHCSARSAQEKRDLAELLNRLTTDLQQE